MYKGERPLMRKKLYVLLTIIMIFLISCGNYKKDNTSESMEESTKVPFTIVEKNYNREGIAVPKIYIDTKLIPNRDEYVETSIKIIDESKQYSDIEVVNGKIKVRGHTTAYGTKIPYNIKFSDKKNILGMGNSKKWCLIANLFDPTLMRNMLAMDFARNMGLDYTPKCEYIELFYNGQDQGLYLICQPVSEGKDKVDLDLSEGDCLLQLQPNYEYSDKMKITTHTGLIFTIEEGKDKEIENISKFINDFENSIAYGIDAVEEYADIESFVDYYVFNELFKDVDFATSSTYFYIKEGKIYAGPIWDYDLSAGNVDYSYYEKYNNIEKHEENYAGFYCQELWFMYLWQIPEFREKVIDRFFEIQPLIENLTTDNELGVNRIDNIINIYGEDFKHNFTIWDVSYRYGPNSKIPLSTYEENVEFLRSWLINRNNWLKNEWT